MFFNVPRKFGKDREGSGINKSQLPKLHVVGSIPIARSNFRSKSTFSNRAGTGFSVTDDFFSGRED